jgi:predicted ATPase/signal transduction histidine kinase
MTPLPGYEVLEKIGEGFNTVLFRAYQLRNKRPVILKVLNAEYPSIVEIAQLSYEYEITSRLDIEGVLKPIALEQLGHVPLLVLEDYSGSPLNSFTVIFRSDPATFLQFAIQVSATLGEIHQNDLIHRHINPGNILFNPDTKQVKITGFGDASRLAGEGLSQDKEGVPEGMLAYMSPEQTGRMNRMLDYRTDFYSLGVVFYELLTGQRPFPTTDPLELVHAHIAKQPNPPQELNSQIPIAMAEIVTKLLAKMAEDRYQSAVGLKADLERCLDQLRTKGEIQTFSLGQNDISDRFQVSQKLYGRHEEIAILLETFAEVSRGKVALMLVAGYSGVGKSTLVNEVQKPIVQRRGIFISGKFDQLHREIPYSALIQAFQALIQQILVKSEGQIIRWRDELLNAVGQIGQVVIDVIPEVALIIGPQPAVPHLTPTEAQNRFQLVFKRFIQVFASQEHPLVIFLDDLQWVGAATITLLQELVSDSEIHHLFLIGAFRDNEIGAGHPLALALNEMDKSRTRFTQLKLQPLGLAHVCQLIIDTLHCSPEKSLPFAQLLLQKTNGNPFFLTQLLHALYQEGLFRFDDQSRQWLWDLEQIEAVEITDNVVDLMIQKLQKLPAPAQRCAQLAACIGNRFDMKTLATIGEKSPASTADDLWPVARAGLIQPVGEWNLDHIRSGLTEHLKAEAPNPVYRFLHDRVQQAAYALIPVEQRQTTHLKIGRLLVQDIESGELEEKIFDVVNHLNTGAALISVLQEQIELAKLNLLAGKKAKSAAAYDAALNYLSAGILLLPEMSWQKNYDLALALYAEATEAAFMGTDFASSETYAKVVLGQAKTLLEKVKVFELQMQAYISRNQMVRAVEIGLEVLDLLGVTLEIDLRDDDLILPQIEELEHLPVMVDPEQLAALRILVALAPPAFQTRPEVFPHIIRTQIHYCMMHGLSALAAVSYGLYGFLLLSGPQEDIAAGYHAGQISLKLLDLFEAQELKCKVLFIFNGHIRHWRDHAEKTLEPFREGIQSGLESGDLQFVGYNAKDLCAHMFFMGRPLQEVAGRMTDLASLLKNIKQEHSTYYIQIWQQAVMNLLDQGNSRTLLSGTISDARALIPSLLETNNRNLLFITYLAEAMLHYLYREYEKAVYKFELAAEHEESSAGLMNIGPYNYYSSLALLAYFPEVSPGEQKRFLTKVEENQQRIRRWAKENYQHAYQLVEAEKARVLGQVESAMAYYDHAITSAIENGFTNIEALANERAAIFYRSLGREKIAQLYLREAYFAYLRWGATAKARDLEQNYAQLLSAHQVDRSSVIPQSSEGLLAATLAEISGEASLDLAAVLRSSQAISGEIVLERLLASLLRIVIENAGAEKAFLLLEQDGELVIQASGLVDGDVITVRQGAVAATDEQLSTTVVNFVNRTGENLVLNDAAHDPRFGNCTYIAQIQPKSLLCMPVFHHSSMIGILYLENNLTTGAFTPKRIKTLQILASQAAISLENARLYAEINREEHHLRQLNEQLEDYSHNLEQKVTERTYEIEQRRKVAESLRGILAVLNSNRTRDEILSYIVSEASLLLASDTSAIYQFDRQDDLFHLQSIRGHSANELSNKNFPIELSDEIKNGQPVPISSFEANNPPMSGNVLQDLAGNQALLAVPLVVSGEIYGCLALYYSQEKLFSPEEIGLAMAFGDQVALAIENDRLRNLVKQAAVMEERGRLARELHDSVTQSLFSLTLLAEGWQRMLRSGKMKNVAEPLAELGEIAQQALKEMRLLVYQLRPPTLEQEGLLGALHQRLSAVEKRAGVQAQLIAEDLIELAAPIEEGLYRIAQEALNNSLKHAGATSVTVRLVTNNGDLVLEVADDGKGFDLDSQDSHQGGLGLLSMQERASRMGGYLEIYSTIGSGTTVVVRLHPEEVLHE